MRKGTVKNQAENLILHSFLLGIIISSNICRISFLKSVDTIVINNHWCVLKCVKKIVDY